MTRWERSRARLQQRVDALVTDTALFPIAAVTASGAGFRLRIEAMDAQAITVGGANDLAAGANDSHRAHLPPGVQLQPGEEITTADGDVYLVVPPLQRDSLGDTVGLSWQRSGASSTSPGPVTGEAPAPQPAPNPDDAWWKEGL